MGHVVVTISRQLGSGGAYIGQEVARILGVRYVDREILSEAASVLEEDPTILEGREERVSGFLESLFRTMCLGAPDAGYFPPPFPIIYDDQIFACEARIIRKIALEESAVIVGRGGYHFLEGHAGAVHVFLHAPKEARVRRVMELYRVSDRDRAEQLVTDSDDARRKFNEKITGARWGWGCAFNFDLCMDTQKVGMPMAIDTIVTLARRVRG